MGDDPEFIPLTTSLVAPIEWLDDIPPDIASDLPDVSIDDLVSDLPDVWRAEFVALVRSWAQLTDIVMFGPAFGDWCENVSRNVPGATDVREA